MQFTGRSIVRWVLCVSTLCASAAVLLIAQQQQPPTFRSGVDLFAVDVQVVDRDGKPVPALGPEKFEVSIGGKRRKVVSAQFIEHGQNGQPGLAQNGAAPGDPRAARPTDRLFFLAIDESSFAAGDTRAMVLAAQKFIEQLAPSDYVGLVAYPSGVQVSPSQLHQPVIRALDKVIGHRAFAPARFRLRPSELIAISSRANGCTNRPVYSAATCDEEVEPIMVRSCGAETQCRRLLIDEARALAQELEDVAEKSFDTLGRVMRALAPVPMRKIVVLVTAGLLLSGQPGVAPDVGKMPTMVGHEAARANAAVYTLFVDRSFIERFTAENRDAPASNANLGLDGAIMEQALAQFTGTVGGALIRAVSGDPELAFRRVITETSAHYLLGVEPEVADRDGQPRALTVKANTGQRGTAVRSRLWAVMQK
jgi:VWFA-related protein